MPKQVARDVFGELLETGKQSVKAGGQAVKSVAGQTAKTILGQKSTGSSLGQGRLSSRDRLEEMRQARQAKLEKEKQQEKSREDQVKRLSEMDKRKSRQAYEEIQKQIDLYRKKKAQAPRKYTTAQTGFDDEQVKDPEGFFAKMKKKKEEMKKKILPWTSKKGMGTGEIRRGASG